MKNFVLFCFALACSLGHAAEIIHDGQLASDPRFTDELAAHYEKNPSEFAHPGLYVTERPVATKEVVLFIHGMAGHPGNWSKVEQAMDKDRYQGWFAYYASGDDLRKSAESVAKQVQALIREYNIQKVHVVSHSMGGLVAWHVANLLEDVQVEQLLTIATPWNGHWASRFGVLFSRNAPEAWASLVPGNPFLEHIWNAPNPVPHRLVHAVQTASALGDGVISTASQTVPQMAQKAEKVVEVMADHMSVIEDPENVRVLLALL